MLQGFFASSRLYVHNNNWEKKYPSATFRNSRNPFFFFFYTSKYRYTGCPNKMITPFDRLILQVLKIRGIWDYMSCLEQEQQWFWIDFLWGKTQQDRTKQISMVNFLIIITFDRSGGFRSNKLHFKA